MTHLTPNKPKWASDYYFDINYPKELASRQTYIHKQTNLVDNYSTLFGAKKDYFMLNWYAMLYSETIELK